VIGGGAVIGRPGGGQDRTFAVEQARLGFCGPSAPISRGWKGKRNFWRWFLGGELTTVRLTIA